MDKNDLAFPEVGRHGLGDIAMSRGWSDDHDDVGAAHRLAHVGGRKFDRPETFDHAAHLDATLLVDGGHRFFKNVIDTNRVAKHAQVTGSRLPAVATSDDGPCAFLRGRHKTP